MLIEKNFDTLLGIRFLATEFPTAGRPTNCGGNATSYISSISII